MNNCLTPDDFCCCACDGHCPCEPNCCWCGYEDDWDYEESSRDEYVEDEDYDWDDTDDDGSDENAE